MTDLKQIKYFVTCVEAGSFSRAAEVLFTTQSSVSKTIKAMESKLGIKLFERKATGIYMTSEAENIYQYALNIMDNLQKIEPSAIASNDRRFSVSCNPDIWFADVFIAFYREHEIENIHYRIHTTDRRDVALRVRQREDDMGFVYIMANQLTSFQYFLNRNYLEFVPLAKTNLLFYAGKKGMIHPADFEELRLIQQLEDEFSEEQYWDMKDKNGKSISASEAVVVTNSDYIVEQILENSELVQVRCKAFSDSAAAGLEEQDSTVEFGCIKRKDEELTECASLFLDFVKVRLGR